MSQPPEQYYRTVIGGSNRSMQASILRGILAAAEPLYAGGMRLRNWFYDFRTLSVHSLGRPTISVGNITTGGTGKTPTVRWLAEKFSSEKPAVLMRGYKSANGISDEQQELAGALGEKIPVIANPSRVRGAAEALAKYPQTGIFILDDAMQHRRARRDFELVLINAREPFGYDRVSPRGLLREPMSGLRRAHAFLITHANEIAKAELARIENTIRRFNAAAPIFRSDHVVTELRTEEDKSLPLDVLRDKPFLAFCGIGSPEGFLSGYQIPALVAFDDHHDYTEPDAASLQNAARSAGAAFLVTTEKDWMKFKRLPAVADALPVYRAELRLRLWEEDEAKLLELIRSAMNRASLEK